MDVRVPKHYVKKAYQRSEGTITGPSHLVKLNPEPTRQGVG